MECSQSLFDSASVCLDATRPAAKLALTRRHAEAFAAGEVTLVGADSVVKPIGEPGRPSKPHLVAPRNLAQRGLGSIEGRAALVHAVAHIEFNAINLAWDAVYRFRGMPEAYYRDWVMVADDEARHFGLVEARLNELGFCYGDFDAHNGLWEMAEKTAHSCVERMALVPRVLEARGLDVTPGMIARLRSVGDNDTAEIFALILREEVAHVAAGSRWFAWGCEQRGLDPETTFDTLLKHHLPQGIKGPFNTDARLRAGFSHTELGRLHELAA
ncbi:MAG: ferritin-like domain-containing protein [Dokdonella sp.]